MISLRDLAGLVWALIVAAALGLGLTWWTTSERFRPGSLRIGSWTAWPLPDPQDADRYIRARIARSGDLPLGPGEGLAFTALADSDGVPLDGRCRYRIVPILPPARWWTLAIYDGAGRTIANPSARHGFISSAVLRGPGGVAAVTVAPDVQPGNWLPSAPGPFRLVLRLYDSPISGGWALSERSERVNVSMPEIRRDECLS
ncbi:DUF1214 domain-containing protein [Labrys monachus]|uniref:DUF1214 domain-containing protein n=1 Tax=Labrys monachus TaxID=217067 RepID=A0ABU0FJ48_9HYPH|nr:DUF1214 domain-containing protein [Labrys monachus]MDQ0394551.1 hypothetical protein [Labrys monachus]